MQCFVFFLSTIGTDSRFAHPLSPGGRSFITNHCSSTLGIYSGNTGDVLYSQTCFTPQPNKMLIEVFWVEKVAGTPFILCSKMEACSVFKHFWLKYTWTQFFLVYKSGGLSASSHMVHWYLKRQTFWLPPAQSLPTVLYWGMVSFDIGWVVSQNPPKNKFIVRG